MDSARPSNSNTFVSLQETAQKLGVTVAVLLEWNEHNILKPTISSTGQVGYTEDQINQFLTIRQRIMSRTTSEITESASMTTSPHEQLNTKTPGRQPKTHAPQVLPRWLAYAATGGAALLLTAIFILPANTTSLRNSDTQIQKGEAGNENDLSAQSSPFKLPEYAQIEARMQLNKELFLAKNLYPEGEKVLKEKITTQDVLVRKSRKSTSINQDQVIAISSSSAQATSGTREFAIASVDDPTGDIPGLTTFAMRRGTCPSCETQKSDDNLAFDDNGDIKGETSKDGLTSLDKIGLGVSVDSFRQVNTDPKAQLLFFAIGMSVFIFMFRQQFSYAFVRPHVIKSAPVHTAHMTQQKILEVAQKTDGTVVLYFLGKEFKISKPEMNSESDQFIERLMTLTQPDMKEIEYDIVHSDKIRLITPLSRLVTRLGFVGIKRDLFFPRTSKTGVLFRKYVTQEDLAAMNLTTAQVLADLTRSTN